MFTIVVLITIIAIIKNNNIIILYNYIYICTLVRNHGNPAVIKHRMLENDT